MLAAAATVAVVVGVLLRHPGLIQIAVWAAVALGFAWWQVHNLLQDISVERRHAPRAFQGGRVAVALIVAGRDRQAAELVRVEDSFPPAVGGRLRRMIAFPLGNGTAAEIVYTGSCDHRRGAYILGPVVLETFDAMGIFPRRVDVACFTRLTVFPQAVDLPNTDVLGEGVLRHVGLEVHHRLGSSEEFLGVRDYRHGDPRRLVHWRSTARRGHLTVKQFEEELTTVVCLYLDLGKLGLAGVGDQTSLEYAVRCCASLARRTVELGHQLEYFGVAEKVDHVPRGAGVSHLLTVLDRLAFARAEGESGYLAVVHDLLPLLPMGSTAIMVVGASVIDTAVAESLVGLMLARRVLPIFVLIDDRAFIKIYRDQEERHHAAPPLEAMAEALTLAGARIHIVRRERVMEDAVAHSLGSGTSTVAGGA